MPFRLARQQPLSLEQRKAGFARRIGGYYEYPELVFSAVVASSDRVFLLPREKFVADCPELQDNYLTSVFDVSPFRVYPRVRALR